MENIEHLIIYFKDFENKIKELLQTGEEVLKHKIKSISDINELEKLIDEWINNCDEFFKKSFNKEDNEFRKIFKQPIYQYKKPSINRNNQNILENSFNVWEQEKKIKNLVEKIKGNLEYIVKIISVCDLHRKPHTVDINKNKNFTIIEKEHFILEKLYELRDDSRYFSLEMLYQGNGLIEKGYNEIREIAKSLKNNNYIDMYPSSNSNNAKITLDGQKYIEEIKQILIQPSQEETENLNAKIDEILDKLTKMGFGQEIIYKELQELKDLYQKLSKKNWKQILIGKLIDLGISQVVDKEIIKEIFNNLTGQTLNLPKF